MDFVVFLHTLVLLSNQGSFLYFVIANGLYTFLFLVSSRTTFKHLQGLGAGGLKEILDFELAPSVSVLVPAYNEEASIVVSVRSLLKLEYGNYEVVVINDGSDDRTLHHLKAAFDLRPLTMSLINPLKSNPVRGCYISRKTDGPRLIVVDKEKGGKADALNAGISYARGELYCVTDADSILERDALLRTVKPFLDRPDTVAVGGIVRLANGSRFEDGRPPELRLPTEHLVRFQVVEYLRAFLFGRSGYSELNALLIIAGAFGVLRRDVVLEIGGYRTDRVGEDMDLVVRVHKHLLETKRPYHITFVGDPICWTQAPHTYRDLARQRNRWYRGLVEVLWAHRNMCLNPRYGMVGMFAYPSYVLVEALGPLIEMGGYLSMALSLAFGWVDAEFALMFLAMAVVYGLFLSVGAVLLEDVTFRRYPRWQDAAILIFYAALENFGYRQLHVWWRLQGLWDLMRGRRQWGDLQRKGFGTVPLGDYV